MIRIYEDNETITRQKIISVTDTVTKIPLDDSFATFIEVIDKNFGLLLYRFRVSLMKYMNSNGNLIEPQKRVFELSGKKEELEVATSCGSRVHGKTQDKTFNEWIQERKYEEQLKELEKSKAFVQYFGDEEEKALSDIRELINQYGERGIYIWDPYLSAIDIKNTLYYAKNTYLPMKAISGLKQDSKEKAKQDMLVEFQKDKKDFLFLDLEVRGKVGSHGYDFHDRFLIFPLEQPKVWSLGISVNQLGASHHILHEVKNAQHILNAFNKLWNELNSKECLVWKSN